jgi:hypothetical protein
MDRRRRAILDTVATDADYAVEDVRAKRRARARNAADSRDEDFNGSTYRDPGYSQAVRRACQQRMVQLIPVRRGTLTLVLTCMWILWSGLVFAHYWLHVQPSPGVANVANNAANSVAGNTGAGNTVAASSLDNTSEVVFASANANVAPSAPSAPPAIAVAQLPIAQLFNLRSTHSIGHWLTCQLWMLTALAAWMIFQLRRHKLDDYRARYRIWIVLAIAALFCSFDASSSFLGLLGMSIDSWTRREIGYGGWPLVLATFASLIGVMGIRLCNELRSAPGSVACWMIGLLAWATSALLGTGLIKTSVDPTTIDLIVGSCWLGGILCVFQSAGIYLRQTYVHAQKRFLERSGSNLQPIKFSAPKLSLPFRKKNRDADYETQGQYDDTQVKKRKGWRTPWARRRNDQDLDEQRTDETKSKNRMKSELTSRSSDLLDDKPTKPKGTLFGFVKNRQTQNERLEDEPIREDDGPELDNGLTKKRGWFGIGGNRDAEPIKPKVVKQAAKQASKSEEKQAGDVTSESKSTERQGVWSKMRGLGRSKTSESVRNSDSGTKAPAKNEDIRNEAARNLATKNLDEKKPKESKAPSEKSSWFGFGKGSKASSEGGTVPNGKLKVEPKLKVETKSGAKSETGDAKPKRGIFGMFDGLKLKPPSDSTTDSVKPTKPDNRATLTKPIPVQQGPALPSTRDDQDDEDEDSDSGRPLSKAERKRMRRGQDDRRAA